MCVCVCVCVCECLSMSMRHDDVSGAVLMIFLYFHYTADAIGLYGIYYIVISGGGAVSLEIFCKIPVGSKLKI